MIIVFLFYNCFSLVYQIRMNRKVSRNKKHKYSKEEKLVLGENENTSALTNIVQEDESNIFELLQNLWINNLQFVILKWSRFCLFVTFVFILLLLYTQMFLILLFSWLEKEGKKQFKSQPPPLQLLKFSIFSNPPTISSPPQLIVFDIFSNHPYYSTPPSIRDLRVLIFYSLLCEGFFLTGLRLVAVAFSQTKSP